jgi:hypothetical protein
MHLIRMVFIEPWPKLNTCMHAAWHGFGHKQERASVLPPLLLAFCLTFY